MKMLKGFAAVMIKNLTKKLEVMKRNGSNCADVQKKIDHYKEFLK